MFRVAAVATLLAIPAVMQAQGSRLLDEPENRGYLLGTPRGTLAIRTGFAQPNASSDVFTFVSDMLTLNRNDFGGALVSADAGILFANRFEVTFGLGVSSRTVKSTYRDFVDNDDQEIRQSTQLRRDVVSIGGRFYLIPQGRSLGRYAWVPNRISTYVGAGTGGVYHRFRQSGDFVDYNTLDVFNTTLQSNGWSPLWYATAGVSWSVVPRASAVFEARYDDSRGEMGDAFLGFEKIDLSGTSLSVGLQFRL